MEVEKYDIELDINFDGLKYTGKEIIDVQGSGEKFYLNSEGINVTAMRSGGSPITFRTNEDKQTIETDFAVKGKVTVEVEFSASVSESLHGLYDAKYPGGHMLTTQFESTGARRTFPCIDHPLQKAIFSLKLIIDKDLEAISNMPVAREENVPGNRKKVVFGDTPVMSTYLVYIGVGHFDHLERDMNGVKGIFSAPKGQLLSTDFPLVEAENIIGYFEDFYGIKYVLPKLHLISVPEFAAGAMENWGAITFREVLLIVNESTSVSVKQTVSEVVAHEIAHQWFGDLVTMEWWNDLWLNESFATFMAFKAVDSLHPDWEMIGKFLLTETAGALTADALKNTHPIDADVKSPEDIAQIFDEISYGKGASILRMIEGYVGERNFRDGIRKYLNDHRYGNAKGSDLWSSIEQVSGMPVSRIMEGWIEKEGYPVLELKRTGDKIKITQKRFTFSGEKTSQLWPVPLTVVRTDGVESVLMEDRDMEIAAEGFIKLNADQSGFYRVLYEGSFMDEIDKHRKELSVLNSWGIVNDLFAFLRSREISLDEYLKRIGVFFGETNYVVAQEITGQLFTLHLIMPDSETIKSVATRYYMEHLKRMGDKRQGEDETVSMLRGSMSVNLSVLDPDFSKEMGFKFKDFFKVDPDLRQAVSVAYSRWKNDYEALKDKLFEAKSDEDRLSILSGLCRLSGRENFEQVMKLAESENIKKQDTIRVYISLAFNPDQRERMSNRVRDAVAVSERYFQGTAYTGMMLEAMVPFLGLGREEEMRRLLSEIRKESFSKGIDKGLELLHIYSGLLTRSR